MTHYLATIDDAARVTISPCSRKIAGQGSRPVRGLIQVSADGTSVIACSAQDAEPRPGLSVLRAGPKVTRRGTEVFRGPSVSRMECRGA
jgi:hypothetical protein